METKQKIEIHSEYLLKKHKRSKSKNKTTAKDERHIILQAILEKLHSYFITFFDEFKHSPLNPDYHLNVEVSHENKYIANQKELEQSQFILNNNLNENTIQGINEGKKQGNSKQMLENVKNYFNEHINIHEEIEIKQPFEQPITEDSFYNMAFYYINVNYLSGEVVNKITNLQPKNYKVEQKENYIIKCELLQKICKFFEIIKTYKFKLLERKPLIYQSVYRDFIVSCFIDYSQIFSELYELVVTYQELTFVNKAYLFNKYTTKDQFTWESVESIATSPAALEAYFEIAKKQHLFNLFPEIKLDKKEIDEKKKQIKQEILRILKEYRIYKGDLNTTNQITYGISSFNKNILLNIGMR